MDLNGSVTVEQSYRDVIIDRCSQVNRILRSLLIPREFRVRQNGENRQDRIEHIHFLKVLRPDLEVQLPR